MSTHNLYFIFAAQICICANRITALHNTILNMRIVSDVNIIQNNRIFNYTVTFLQIPVLNSDRILYCSVYNTSACDQAVLDFCSHIVFCRSKVIHLGVDIRLLMEEIFAESPASGNPCLSDNKHSTRGDITPVIFQSYNRRSVSDFCNGSEYRLQNQTDPSSMLLLHHLNKLSSAQHIDTGRRSYETEPPLVFLQNQ